MYQPRTRGYDKSDPVKRWNLPDRVFFACGACHILAYAYLERFATAETLALWIKPAAGYTGNHIVVATDTLVFDYHGWSDRERYFDHTVKRAQQRWHGWTAELIPLPPHVLVSNEASRAYDGLWLREPDQFYRDALPRARAFLCRLHVSRGLS